MKKLLLLLTCIIINLNCNSSLNTTPLSFNAAFKHVVNTTFKERTLIQTAILGTAAYWFYTGPLVWKMLDHVVTNDDIPLEQIKPTILEWHKEKSTIFNSTIKITDMLPPFFGYSSGNNEEHTKLIEDVDKAYRKLSQLMPKISVLDCCIEETERLHKSNPSKNDIRMLEIINALKEINAPRILSDEELDLFVKIQKTGAQYNSPDVLKKQLHLIGLLTAMYTK